MQATILSGVKTKVRMMKNDPEIIPLRALWPVLLAVLLSACSKGPDTSYQLATQGLLSATLSQDGTLALVGSIHHGGSLWDVERNERLFSWNHQAEGFSSFRTVALSGNNKVALTTEEKSIGIWSTKTGESLNFLEASDRVLAVAINEQGTRALIGMRGGGLDYFDLEKGLILQSMQHETDVRSVGISADGKTGISGSDDFSAMTWNLEEGKALHRMTLDNQIKTVALSSSGQRAFTSAQREGAMIWDSNTGAMISALPSRYTNYPSAVFSEDESELLLGTSAGQVQLVAVETATTLAEWQTKPRKAFGGASSKAVLALAFGKQVTAIAADGMLQNFSK